MSFLIKKISTIISSLLLSINAFKSLTIGSELGVLGSDYHDEISWSKDKFKRDSNSAGGIEGGMSNANPIILTMEMKPLSTPVSYTHLTLPTICSV